MDSSREGRWNFWAYSGVLSGRDVLCPQFPATLWLANVRLSLPGRNNDSDAHRKSPLALCLPFLDHQAPSERQQEYAAPPELVILADGVLQICRADGAEEKGRARHSVRAALVRWGEATDEPARGDARPTGGGSGLPAYHINHP
jgi:hypothetical protein